MSRPAFMKVMIFSYLMKNQELTGYDFIKFCRENGIPASSGNVYPHLKALEEAGFIDFKEEGKKKIYSLTKKGEKKLAQSPLTTVPEFMRDRFLRTMNLAVSLDWQNAEELEKLLANVKENKTSLENYIRELKK